STVDTPNHCRNLITPAETLRPPYEGERCRSYSSRRAWSSSRLLETDSTGDRYELVRSQPPRHCAISPLASIAEGILCAPDGRSRGLRFGALSLAGQRARSRGKRSPPERGPRVRIRLPPAESQLRTGGLDRI